MLSANRQNSENAAKQTPSKQLGADFSRLDFASSKKAQALFECAEFGDDDFAAPTPRLMPEPLLVANAKRFVLFPIQYQKIWLAYKNAEAKFWSAEEIEFFEDVDDWKKVNNKERACILHALALMSVNDTLAGDEPIISKLSDEIQSPEARCFFGFHIMQKNIHAETLNVLIDVFSKSAEDKEYLFDALENMPTTSKRTAWIQKHITESPCSYSTRLFALATYCSLFNSSAQSLLLHICTVPPPAKSHAFPGLQKAIVKMQADLTRCVQFLRLVACEHLVNPVNGTEAAMMVREAVALEKEVCAEIFEMAGAGSGKKGVEVCGVFVDAASVGKRVERLGEELIKTFAVKGAGSVLFSGVKKSAGTDGLEWMDTLLWSLVKIDSGVVEHVATARNSGDEKQKAQEKMNVKQEFSLDEDF